MSKIKLYLFLQQVKRSLSIPFANIGRWTSRTFPSIGRTRNRTPFSRGVNCNASIELKTEKGQ